VDVLEENFQNIGMIVEALGCCGVIVFDVAL